MHLRWLAMAMAVALWSCGDDSDPVVVDAGTASTDGGPGTDAGPGTDSGSGLDAGPAADGGDGRLTNEPAMCAMDGFTFADVPNAGHYAAARLTPPTYPFTVTSVHYWLAHSPGMCDADQPHDVLVFTGTASTPPDTPAGETVTVPAPTTPTEDGMARFVDLTLSTPVVVGAGEELFVAVQMVRTGDPLCVGECLDPGEADRNWWSAAAATPFPWRTLASYGNDGTLTFAVRGP